MTEGKWGEICIVTQLTGILKQLVEFEVDENVWRGILAVKLCCIDMPWQWIKLQLFKDSI